MEKSTSKKKNNPTTTPKEAPTTTQPDAKPVTGYKISMQDFTTLVQLLSTIGIDKYRQQAIFACMNESFKELTDE
jgi:myosin heavy subunit